MVQSRAFYIKRTVGTLWKPVEPDTVKEMECSYDDIFSRYKEMADIDAATAVLDRFGHSIDKSVTYATLSGVPESTLRHRAHGRALSEQCE
jgi:hypothetical protein